MDKELNYNTQALAYTLVIYGIILVLCYLTYLSIPYTQSQIEAGGVEVNYGNTDKGMGDDYTSTENPSVSPRPNHKISTEIKAVKTVNSTKSSSTEKEVYTQNNEEAEAIKTNERAQKTRVQSEYINPNPSPKPPKINQNALYKGPSSSGSGGGDGNSNQAGNQGVLNGSVLSRNYTGSGGNGGGGVSLSLVGRKFMARPHLTDDGQTEGKIVVDITVDNDGNIVSAVAGGRGTTIQSEELWIKCEAAVKRVKVNKISSGTDNQTGSITFIFKLH